MRWLIAFVYISLGIGTNWGLLQTGDERPGKLLTIRF